MTDLLLDHSVQPTVFLFPIKNKRTDKTSFMVVDGWGFFAIAPDRPSALVTYTRQRQNILATKDYKGQMETRHEFKSHYVHLIVHVVQRLGPMVTVEKAKKPPAVSGETIH
jgi:hypothetical protein